MGQIILRHTTICYSFYTIPLEKAKPVKAGSDNYLLNFNIWIGGIFFVTACLATFSDPGVNSP